MLGTQQKTQLKFMGYTEAEIYNMEDVKAGNILARHKRSLPQNGVMPKFKPIHKKASNVIRNVNASSGASASNAHTKHNILSNELLNKSNFDPEIKKPEYTSHFKKLKNSVTKKLGDFDDVIKRKTSSSPRLPSTRRIMNRFRGSSTKTKIGLAMGLGLSMTFFIRSFSGRDWGAAPSVVQNTISHDRDSAYIPAKYRRGYDYIKEHTSDFGSRVHLQKTAAKVLVSARNSTRDAITKTTRSVTAENIALYMNKHAIGHTRY